MSSAEKRPVNLDLWTIRLPITALASILHRISGLFIFVCVPVLLWLLQCSLQSEASFAAVQKTLSSVSVKVFIWLCLAGIVYHTLAGIRHLLMDFGRGEELSSGRLSAKIVIISSVVISLLLGVWLWG